MASQTVSAAKRYRISLLLDVYSELLTEKQRTFLRHYYEEDLSFGRNREGVWGFAPSHFRFGQARRRGAGKFRARAQAGG